MRLALLLCTLLACGGQQVSSAAPVGEWDCVAAGLPMPMVLGAGGKGAAFLALNGGETPVVVVWGVADGLMLLRFRPEGYQDFAAVGLWNAGHIEASLYGSGTDGEPLSCTRLDGGKPGPREP